MIEKKSVGIVPRPAAAIQENVTLDPVPQTILEKPTVEQKIEGATPTAAVVDKVKELVKPTPKSIVKPAPKPKAKPAAPAPVKKPVETKPADGMNYITNKLPCVWTVGTLRETGNINRVVARLRFNRFDVAAGFHEKEPI